MYATSQVMCDALSELLSTLLASPSIDLITRNAILDAQKAITHLKSNLSSFEKENLSLQEEVKRLRM